MQQTTLFDTVAILTIAASVFGYINHKVTKLPFAIGLMMSGLLGSLVIIVLNVLFPGLALTHDVNHILSDIDFADALMHGMLGFLLFAGALHTDMDHLRRWAASIGVLASVGVIISTAIIGAGTWVIVDSLGLNVPFIYCMVFGALITPTDPVAVLGIMKAAGAPKEVEIKVIGESLFNDGVGVVVFTVLLSIATGGGAHGHASMEVASVFWLIIQEVVGGVALGMGTGYVAYLALRSLNEPNLEVLISVALVMGITLFGFQLHTSAPLGCVVAGLFIGNRGRHDAMSDETERAVDTVWSFVDEGLNALLFLMVGLEVVRITYHGLYVAAAVLVIILGIAARGIAVWLPITLMGLRSPFRRGTRLILWWGGIKGGLALALALSLPEFEGRELILAVTYASVIVSVLVQGLTIGKVIQRAGLAGD